MSRLSRLRSFWRSLRRGTVRDGSYRPHQAVNLLPTEYRHTGGLRTDGSWVLSASTGTKEHGTRTPETGTLVVFSSYSQPHIASTFPPVLITHHPVSSCTARFSYGDGTEDPGASGVPRGPAV